MKITLFYTLIILGVISIGTAYAEGSLISVQTDNNNYSEKDTIIISGEIATIIGDTQVTMQLFQGANLIEIAQIKVSQDGNYSHRINAEGPLWTNQGTYMVKVTYGEANVAETLFDYTPESKIFETTKEFEVDAGDTGTFDIKYHIKGGIIKDIVVDPQILGLVVDIEAQHDGTLTLDLPRQYIDAEKQDGKDDVFIILIDNMETTYDEPTLYSEIRTITIDFQKDDSKIQIIGTHVIPEFGTIVMIVLTIGIMASIVLTRNRFQIKI